MIEWLKRTLLRPSSSALEPFSPEDEPGGPDAEARACKTEADAHWDAGRVEFALRSYRAALERCPDYAEAWNNYGLCLRNAGHLAAAEDAFRQATVARPGLIAAWVNLASMEEEEGRADAAMQTLEQALRADPASLEARHNLAGMKSARGNFHAAIADYRRGLEHHPYDAGLHFHLALTLLRAGRVGESLEEARHACHLDPGSAMARSAYLLHLNYADHLDPAHVFAEHVRVAAELPAVPEAPPAGKREPGARLRVGYFSADFGRHVVSFFIEPVLEAHDRARVEVFAYYSGREEDDQSRRLSAYCDHWRHIAMLDDAAALRLARADGLDIAVDLSGHTGGNRLALFAAGVAPVQVTWLGYPNTTGVRAIGHRLTDAESDPPGTTESLHTESLLRLPEGFLTYRPRAEAPPVAPLPALASGSVTFGCFNNFAKVSDTALAMWARILQQVPDARLLLKSKGLHEPEQVAAVRSRFAAQGGDVMRLVLEGERPGLSEHLARYGAIDIALDSYPYGGTTTTCEALWMGVPVVSLAGPVHASRVGASLLARVGHPEWVARTPEHYTGIACDLASDFARLAACRAALREEVARSPLTDAVRFTRQLEAAYRRLAGDPAA